MSMHGPTLRRLRMSSSLGSLLLVCASPAGAQLSILNQFSPGLGELVSAGYDAGAGSVWIYGSFDADVRSYTPAGSFVSSVPRPGESADDVNVELADASLVMGGITLPAGTLLFVNGEAGAAEIHAVDTATGTIITTLNTAFGVSHVVGGAYHTGRGTFFLVQDRQPSGSDSDSVVAEIDAATGSVINSFKTDTVLPGWTVNFGDIDVSAVTGNLYVVSNDETSIAEFTPDGSFVQTHALPAGVSSLSGIGIDASGCDAWVSGTAGTVWELDGLCPDADADGDGLPDFEDNCVLVANPSQTDADVDGSETTATPISIRTAQSTSSTSPCSRRASSAAIRRSISTATGR